MTHARKRAAMFALIPLLAASCGRAGEDDDMPTPEEYVGHDAKVLRETLQFTDEAEEARFDAARACFAGRYDAGVADGLEWRHYPLRKIGNFIQEDWCRGDHSGGCSGGSFRSQRGDEWYEVSTLHYDSDWPRVFGIGVSAGQLPRDGDWGVSFSYWANGASIVGEGLHVSFHRFEGGEIAESVHLGDFYTHDLEETTVSLLAPGGPDAVLSRLAQSPAALRVEAVDRLDELLMLVGQNLDAGRVRKCVYGKYEGDGIPPECTLTPLTGPEQDAARIAAQAKLGGQRATVVANAELFHRLLMELLVPDRCWGTPLDVHPSIRGGEMHVPEGEGEPCPYHQIYELRDGGGALRASFHGAVSFWEPLDEHRVLIGLSTCRDPSTGRESTTVSAGDAWQELLEVTLPDEGAPSWRLVLRSNRGDMGCTIAPDGQTGACALRHVGTSIQDLTLLDLSGDVVAARPAEAAESIAVKTSITKPQLRHRDGHFQLLLHDVERRGDERWVTLQEAR